MPHRLRGMVAVVAGAIASATPAAVAGAIALATPAVLAGAIALAPATVVSALLGLDVASASAKPSAAAKLAVSPAPGTPDASPTTQISVLGVPRGQISGVDVSGQVSGSHAGKLRAYSGDRGASFLLSHPLTQGERVHVRVRLRHGNAVAWTFTVAHLGATPPILSIPVMQPDKLDHFVSAPALLPPKITVLKHSNRSEGDIFLTPLPSPTVHPESNNAITIKPVGPGGPMIIDGRGNLVWFDQLKPPVYAINFRPQGYLGHQVLTWWQGSVTVDAFGLGEGVIADGSYGTIRTVRAGNGYPTDLHEFVITPDGDALFTVYSPVEVHLPGTPSGKLSPLLDAIVQEVDIRTGLVVWEWHALGHIPLKESYANPANSADYDAFHINSVQSVPGDRLLISARDTSAVYLVNRVGGRIVWTLGGKASSFRLGRGARFWFQHDAQLVNDHEVSLFDDEAGPPFKAPSSRGLILTLNQRRHTATVLHQYHRGQPDTLAQSEGSLQRLPDGNVFVGFGSTPFFSGFSARGKLVFDASLPTDDGSYREFRFPWSATPRTRPALAARRTSGSQVAVYASWNGATTVARWEVLAGSSARSLKRIASLPDRGFETRINVNSSKSTFAVRALSASGHVLSTSLPEKAS